MHLFMGLLPHDDRAASLTNTINCLKAQTTAKVQVEESGDICFPAFQ